MPAGNELNHEINGLTVVGGLSIRNPASGVSAYLQANTMGQLISGGTSVDQGGFGPADLGFLAWNYDCHLAQNASILTAAGTVWCARIRFSAITSVTNLHVNLSTAGATLTANQCIAGIYQSGALVASTADQSASWAGSTGIKTMALSGGPFTLQPGDALIAFYANGSTLPTFARTVLAAGLANGLSTGSSSRFATADTGRTTSLPATLGTMTATSAAYWVAVS